MESLGLTPRRQPFYVQVLYSQYNEQYEANRTKKELLVDWMQRS